MTSHLLPDLDRAFHFATDVIAGIPADATHSPTPCPEFDVTGLVGHLTSGTRWFAKVPREGLTDPTTVTDDDLDGQDLVAAFTAQADQARTEWTPEDLPRTFGEMTGTMCTSFMVMELIGHGLDLALATSQSRRPDPDLVETSLQIATAMGDFLRTPGMMGPEVPVASDAPLVDRFLGFLGRDPAWSPTR